MRLTAELILKSPSYLNPLKERELDLRGNKISVIENLGVTQDQYDSLDLSDNEIAKVDNFPQLHRLRTLLLNNNKISRIGSLTSIPNLDTLILTNNKILNLQDIDPLAEAKSLRRLSLLDNLITKKQHYRLYVIHVLPKLKVLDFRKIKQKEREASKKLFGERKSNQPHKAPQAHSTGYDAQQSKAITDAIKNVTSLSEVSQLERSLASGQIPK